MKNTFLMQTSGTSTLNTWNTAELISTQEKGETIEMIYKETSMLSLTIHPPIPPEQRVFKIVYSCRDGEWNKSERIYGQIVKSTNESYIF